MSIMLGNKHSFNSRLVLKSFSRRVSAVNTPVVTFDQLVKEETAVKHHSESSRDTIGRLLSGTKSENFVKSLSEVHFSSGVKIDASVVSRGQTIKARIYRLIEENDYESVLDLFLSLSASSGGELAWRTFIEPNDFAFFMKGVINYQIKLMRVGAREKSTFKSKGTSGYNFSEARRFREKIRRLYSNLVYSDTSEHLYHHTKRGDIYSSKNLTGYKLTLNDYENLIYLELHNFKLDLASKLFNQLEKDYPNHTDIMSEDMWILKLQTYSGGLPNLWKKNSNLLIDSYYDPKKSSFTAYKSPMTILEDYVLSKNSTHENIIMHGKFSETLIYALGFSKDINFLLKFIAVKWGIEPNGSMLENMEVSKGNISYPTLNLLKAIVVSLSYNQELLLSMKYINLFQKYYDIDITGKSSKNFWEQVFKWCNYTTAFKEELALDSFLSKTQNMKDKARPTSVEEAQKDANFDYDKFLEYMEELRTSRTRMFHELWSLFNDSTCLFSSNICKIYLDFLKETYMKIEDEAFYYDFLRTLLKFHQMYYISPDSFNRNLKLNKVSDIDYSVRYIYEEGLKSLIDVKWKSNYMGQCQPLINEWALNDSMKDTLTVWLRDQVFPNYNKMIEGKREAYMVVLRTEEDDSLLELI